MSSRLSYVSANGTTYPLDGSDGVRAVNLVEGLTTIATDLLIDQRVASDGGTVTNTRRGPRRIALDFLIPDTNKLNVMDKWGRLQAALAAGGKLVFDGAHGVRELRQVVLESATREVIGPDGVDDIFATSLIALDPYWYSTVVQLSVPVGLNTAWDAAGVAWDAAIPWNGGGTIVVAVEGDLEAFPVFVAQGPLTTATVSLGGEETVSWQIDTALVSSGDLSAVTIDQRPGSRGPRYGAELIAGYAYGGVDWSLLSEDSRVTWGLPSGSASIIVGVTGDTPGTTALTVFWEPRWLTP